jgi:short-subunit dehydrogenase
MELRGRKVLITGASSGIGRALARAFAEEGALVALAARSTERLDALADEIGARGLPRPAVLPVDLAERGSAATLAARAVAALGGVDVLVNDAAIEGVGSYATAGDDSGSRELFETNYWSPMALVRALVPAMRAGGTGTVVNVSSLGAITPIAGTGQYASSKAALAIATEALRTELRGSGVHVVLVYPGLVDTPMLRAFLERADLPDRLRRRLRLMPVGTPEVLARRVVRAVRRRRATVVYPRSYAVTPWMPSVSRWFTDRLLLPSSPSARGARPRACRIHAVLGRPGSCACASG